MKFDTKSILSATALLVGGFIGASALVVFANSSDGTWTSAPVGVPNNNVAAPINVGVGNQIKSGWLGLGGGLVTSGLQVLTATGTTTSTKGSVLSAIDGNGNVGWVTTSSLGISGINSSIRSGTFNSNGAGGTVTFTSPLPTTNYTVVMGKTSDCYGSDYQAFPYVTAQTVSGFTYATHKNSVSCNGVVYQAVVSN